MGGISIDKYVAGSIVAFNLDTRQVKWTRELDLSIDNGTFRAYMYSSPTVVDLDGDGNLDIIVGSSFGLCYVLDHRGNFSTLSLSLFHRFFFIWNVIVLVVCVLYFGVQDLRFNVNLWCNLVYYSFVVGYLS